MKFNKIFDSKILRIVIAIIGFIGGLLTMFADSKDREDMKNEIKEELKKELSEEKN